MPKTSTERTRAWRARQQKKKKIPKTSAERSREYRARQKALKAGFQALPSLLITPPPIVNDDTNLAGPSQLDDDNQSAHREFDKKLSDNSFGFVCGICDRLWFKDDLKQISPEHQQLLATEFPDANFGSVMACECCTQSLHRNHIPTYANLNRLTTNSHPRLYNGRRPATTLVSSQEEFRNLSLNELTTMDESLMELITSNRGLSIFSFNCRSLRAHVTDLNDKVVKNSKILLLSETCLGNEEQLAVPNFDCVVQFKRSQVKNGGVAIYNNSINNTVIVAAHMDINLRQTSSLAPNIRNVGDICAARCILENGETVLAVVVFVSPNQSVHKIIEFIHKVLIVYTHEVSAILKEDYHKLPMILSGNFNVDFASVEARPLVEFLDKKFNLKLNTNPALSTTRTETSIDAVFARYLDQLKSTVYVSYFSFHKPIVSFLKHEEIDIVE